MARHGESQVRSSRSAWPTGQNRVSTKNTKISQLWCHTPVIPATWEAEAGTIAWTQEAEVAVSPRSCHCTPAWLTEQDSISKKLKKKKSCALLICTLSLLIFNPDFSNTFNLHPPSHLSLHNIPQGPTSALKLYLQRSVISQFPNLQNSTQNTWLHYSLLLECFSLFIGTIF